MNGCLLCLGPSKEVRECLCAEAIRGRDAPGTAGRKPALLCGSSGAAKTLKFCRYGAKAVNTIKFEED